MSTATKDALSQADIILNRTNVALARSQRLIQSWLPPKPQAEEEGQGDKDADEDEDFRGDSEIGGIGSAAQRDDPSGLPEGAFKRRNLGANDKLLDSLLGKKAANAHRKAQAQAQAQSRGGSGQAQSASGGKAPVKEAAKRPAQDSDSEEEGGGRAAAFVSKRAKPSRAQPKASEGNKEEDASGGKANDEEPDISDAGAKTVKETSTPAGKGGKKRPASYLDEILGQKANKKSKKKNKSKSNAAAEA